MNVDQFRAFYTVSQTGSFTRAARKLYITQSAVSQQVQALEHSLGITLFDRTGKQVSLTGEGEILQSYAKRVFDLYGEIVNLFELQRTLKKGKISIASTRVLGTYYLPQMIGLFNRQYPEIEIDLKLGNSHRILEIVLEGEVDFGFAGKIQRYGRLNSILVHQERLLLVCSPDHYLASKKRIGTDELIKTPFIWREKGTQTREVVKRWFEKNMGKNYPKKSIELENVEAAKRIVESGYGITIIPEAAVKREIDIGALKNLNLEGFEHSVDFHLFYSKSKMVSKAAETFLKMLFGIRLFSHSENLKEGLKLGF